MSIDRYNYEGNTNIGFYATVTQGQSIFPPGFRESDLFDGDSVETFIGRTRLVGLFTAGNSDCILIPDIISDREREKLEDSDIDFRVLEVNETALGNLILANDHGAVISPRIEDIKEEIEDALQVEAEVMDIADNPTPGVCGVANNHGAVIHRDASEDGAEKVKKILGLEDIDIGTTNMGSAYTGSGAVANDEQVLVGEDTTGPEVGRLDRTLFQH